MAKKLPPNPEASSSENAPQESAPEVVAKSEPTSIVPKGKFGTGHIKDAPDERDYKARVMLGAPRNLPPEASLEQHLRGIRDQGQTSSCVGHAIGTAADTRLRKLGFMNTPDPSRVAIYTFARAMGRSSGSKKLVDDGSQPRLAMKGIREWGTPSEKDWPIDQATINDELPWDVMQKASAFRISQWHRIDSLGHGRVEDICNAIAQGYPVVFGVDVDDNFMNYSGKGAVAAPDPSNSYGGHMMCLVGYTTENSERIFRGVNSWGTGWGDGGLYWAHEGFIKDVTAGDFYVIQCSVE